MVQIKDKSKQTKPKSTKNIQLDEKNNSEIIYEIDKDVGDEYDGEENKKEEDDDDIANSEEEVEEEEEKVDK